VTNAARVFVLVRGRRLGGRELPGTDPDYDVDIAPRTYLATDRIRNSTFAISLMDRATRKLHRRPPGHDLAPITPIALGWAESGGLSKTGRLGPRSTPSGHSAAHGGSAPVTPDRGHHCGVFANTMRGFWQIILTRRAFRDKALVKETIPRERWKPSK